MDWASARRLPRITNGAISRFFAACIVLPSFSPRHALFAAPARLGHPSRPTDSDAGLPLGPDGQADRYSDGRQKVRRRGRLAWVARMYT